MTRIPVHSVDSAPEGSRDALKALEAQFGKVLNVDGAMAHPPAVLKTCVAIQSVLADNALGGEAAGLTEQETIAIRRGQVEDAKTAALVVLVREQAGIVGHVQDGRWQAALEAGWSDAELTETSAVVALNLFTNYFNHLVQTDLDLPAAPAI